MALLQLVTQCEPLKDIPLEYNTCCWHCNPDHMIYPIILPPKCDNECALDLRPDVIKPTIATDYIFSIIKKKQQKRLTLKDQQLKSFDLTDKNKITKSTKDMTSDDILYSRQRTFMYTFGIDVLNKDQFMNFHRIMKAFMIELDYTPSEKQDVVLFYTQESSQDLYDVYLARHNKYIKNFAQVFKINLEHFDDVLEFMQLIKCYMSTTDEYQNINSVNNVLLFFREQDANDVYLIIKMSGLTLKK